MDMLGYGTMQLSGPAAWGPPPDWAEAVDLLKFAYDLGVRLFDSAWYYGPEVTHTLLREAFRPYPEDLTILTKAGNSRGPDRSWVPCLDPANLRRAVELDLRLLRCESIPLSLLRWSPSTGDEDAFREAFDAMQELKHEGKIRALGISNVRIDHVEIALGRGEVAAVSNAFSIYNRRDSQVVDFCTCCDIPVLPYYPLMGGDIVRRASMQRLARDLGVSPAQIAIAWLRNRSAMLVPIAGTAHPDHLRENVEACKLSFDAEIWQMVEERVG